MLTFWRKTSCNTSCILNKRTACLIVLFGACKNQWVQTNCSSIILRMLWYFFSPKDYLFFLNVTHQVSLIIIHTVALQELSLCAHFLTDTHCWHFRESTALFLSDSGLFPHLTFMLHLIGWRRSGTLTPDCFAYLPSVPLVSFNEGLSPWGGWMKVCGPFEASNLRENRLKYRIHGILFRH